jgi:hypothetical protein
MFTNWSTVRMQFPLSKRLLRAGVKHNEVLPGVVATVGCVVSAGAFAWVLAMLVWQVAGPQNSIAPWSPDPALKKRIALINAQHPFGTAAKLDEAAASGMSIDAAGNGPWRLLATMASTDGSGMALLEREGGELKIVRQGEMLTPGEQVNAIGVNGIELSTQQGKRHMELAPLLGGASTPGMGHGWSAPGMPAPRDIVNVPPHLQVPGAASGPSRAPQSN